MTAVFPAPPVPRLASVHPSQPDVHGGRRFLRVANIRRDDEARSDANTYTTAVADMEIREHRRRVEASGPHTARVSERAQGDEGATVEEREVERVPSQLRVGEKDRLPDVSILRHAANAAGSSEPLLLLERRLNG